MKPARRNSGTLGTPARRSCRPNGAQRLARPTEKFLHSCFPYCLVLLPLLLFSCEREQRALVVQPPSAQQPLLRQMSDLAPGPKHREVPSVANSDENNSWSMAEGKRLYEAYNCNGCHAHGGGGMGPPLMDEKWIYGSEPQQIFATIVEGRPNGMPAFRGKIPDEQVWQLVAYVRSVGGLGTSSGSPGRSDELKGPTPPSS